jgi:hypothetical protein
MNLWLHQERSPVSESAAKRGCACMLFDKRQNPCFLNTTKAESRPGK